MAIAHSTEEPERIVMPGENEPRANGMRMESSQIGSQALRDAKILVMGCWALLFILGISLKSVNP